MKPAMPTFLLCVKPELEGLVSFEPGEGCDWKLDFKQSAGSEERKGVVVDPQNEEEVPNAKGDTCQLVMKFDKKDKVAATLSVVAVKGVLRAFTSEDTVAVPIAAFECRGLEPIGWTPTGPYVVRTAGGVAYTVGAEGEDLADDWCDYDEKSGESVSVDASIQFEFRLHKG